MSSHTTFECHRVGLLVSVVAKTPHNGGCSFKDAGGFRDCSHQRRTCGHRLTGGSRSRMQSRRSNGKAMERGSSARPRTHLFWTPIHCQLVHYPRRVSMPECVWAAASIQRRGKSGPSKYRECELDAQVAHTGECDRTNSIWTQSDIQPVEVECARCSFCYC